MDYRSLHTNPMRDPSVGRRASCSFVVWIAWASLQIENFMAELEAGLANKRVVVLGGSSGIGLAVAQQVVAHGAEVVMAEPDNSTSAKGSSPVWAVKVEGRTLDVSEYEQVTWFSATTGRPDHLVFTMPGLRL